MKTEFTDLYELFLHIIPDYKLYGRRDLYTGDSFQLNPYLCTKTQILVIEKNNPNFDSYNGRVIYISSLPHLIKFSDFAYNNYTLGERGGETYFYIIVEQL